MATIRVRKRKDGTESFTAQIIRRNPPHQESRTFDKRASAEAWANRREKEIAVDIRAGRKPVKRAGRRATVGDAIDRYVKESIADIGKTKAQVLKTIRNEYDIADLACDNVTSPDIVEFVQDLHKRPELSSPATAGNYLSHLSGLFSIARPMWGFQLDPQTIKDAQVVCKKMGLTAKPEQRDRRPTLRELNKLLTHFEAAHATNSRTLPMHVVVVFALFSTRREAEICRITWDDFEPDAERVMVRKMKNPGAKGGVDTWCELPAPCCDIIASRPSKSGRIFPYNPNTISRRFTDACKFLEIEDLRFHDLRHEGVSRLAEMGRTVPQMASVSGHKSWKSLEGYTHLRQIGDKYENWKWIKRVQ